MKKFILSACAAGALAFGSAASAQDLGSVLGAILGSQQQPYGSVYTDQYGRQVAVDQWGRHVLVNPGNYGITGHDAWGRPIYGGSGSLADAYRSVARTMDSDGDGVPNTRDRFPADWSRW